MDDDRITGYALLRDGQHWEARITNLAVHADGHLGLQPVPGLAGDTRINLPGPYDVPPSGLAVGECREIYLADTAHNRIIWDDTLCRSRRIAPGRPLDGVADGAFLRPRGLLLAGSEQLYVADSGHGLVQVLLPVTLEARAMWPGLAEPADLAADSKGRVYVLDAALKTVLRYSPRGIADSAYNDALTSSGALIEPVFLAVDGEDRLYVSDRAKNTVLRFAPDGSELPALPQNSGLAPLAPRALAAYQRHLYVADADDGRVWLADCLLERYLGRLPAFQGPVTAMAIDRDGNLYLKTDDAEAYVVLQAGQSYLQHGRLEAGPLDAGEMLGWARLHLQAATPPATQIEIKTFGTDEPTTAPADSDWQATLTDDFLIPPLPNSDPDGSHQPRYLWLRVDFSSQTGAASPALYQAQAETPAEDYLDYLPAIYARRDAEQGFLHDWLALFRAELGDLELKLQDMPRLFDPLMAPGEHLGWLARWLAFDMPEGWSTDERRALFERMIRLYRRRDTLHGLREMIEIYTGTRPEIVESYTKRRLWILGESSRLGFDTGLAPRSPEGALVPEERAAACDSGLPDDSSWSEPSGMVIGEVVVGEGGPLQAANLGEPLFAETAHHFTVFVPAANFPDAGSRHALINMLDAEKPAHTDYHLCFIEPRMRVGFQARVGVDTIIAGPPEPLILNEPSNGLGHDSSLDPGPEKQKTSRVGQQARLGRNLVVK